MSAVIALVLVLAGLVLFSGGFLVGACWAAIHKEELTDRHDPRPQDFAA
jgi:hypothetical protein